MSYDTKDYKSYLSKAETEQAIKEIKDFFLQNISTELRLNRVTAPLFVEVGTGVNDNLSGTEKAVVFHSLAANKDIEIVQSLAKWKRLKLRNDNIEPGFGIITDMNAIRADEPVLDNLHSMYVDQWDWEKVITKEDRNLEYLCDVVKKIYNTILRTEFFIYQKYPVLKPSLPENLKFIDAELLRNFYPQLSPKEREYKFCKEYGATFVIGIGKKLDDGTIHDMRSPDYDDWYLNGDLLVYYEALDTVLEISSMGIRVTPESLNKQLRESGCEDRKELYFHKELLEGKLPLTIGGGIGQSRLCMLLLKKLHIGEVQSSVWPESTYEYCNQNFIELL